MSRLALSAHKLSARRKTSEKRVISLAQHSLFGQLERVLKDVEGLRAVERVTIDEKGRRALHAQAHAFGKVRVHRVGPAAALQAGVKGLRIQLQLGRVPLEDGDVVGLTPQYAPCSPAQRAVS